MEAAEGELAPLTAEQSARMRLRVQQLRAGPDRDQLTARKVLELLSAEAAFSDVVLTLGRVKKVWQRLNKEEEEAETSAPERRESEKAVVVDKLPKWPAGRSVRDVMDKGATSIFSIAEKLEGMAIAGSMGVRVPSVTGVTAFFDFRESLLGIAEHWDHHRTLFQLQDERSTSAITLVVAAVHCAPAGACAGLPVFAVEWSRARRDDAAGALASATALGELSEKLGGGCVIVMSSVEEQEEFWLPQLKQNTQPGRATSHPSLRISAIECPPPAKNPAFNPTPNNRPGTRSCASCQGAAGMTCVGCQSVHYCSTTCQSVWKNHKRVCKKQSQPDADSVVISAIQEGEGDNAQAFTLFNIRGGGVGDVRTLGAVPANPYGARRFEVKLQLMLNMPFMPQMGLRPNMPLLLYDAERSISKSIPPSEAAFSALSRICMTRGLLGGAKIYLWAQREGTDVRIFVGKDIPNQQECAARF